jgi:hypothetical protein
MPSNNSKKMHNSKKMQKRSRSMKKVAATVAALVVATATAGCENSSNGCALLTESEPVLCKSMPLNGVSAMYLRKKMNMTPEEKVIKTID